MDEESQLQQQDKQKKHETESAADLERVTDYAEEKELNVSDVGNVLANLGQTVNAKKAEKEKELSQVNISKEDVELIMNEMEIPKSKAERVLRESKGNVVQALTTLVSNALMFFYSVLLYFGGLAWFILQSHTDISENCYFSENALLPGLVASDFHPSESEIQSINLDAVDANSKIWDELERIMLSSGLDVFSQKFSFQDRLVNGGIQVKNGTNVYGIVRAARAASTECLVINIPLSSDKFNFATGIVLSLAKHMRKQFYWAKDIIFLFSEHGVFGTRAWLNAYNGIATPGVVANQLPARAGSIQSAISLVMEEDAVSYINLLVEGYNGQLPNLDLFNVMVRLVKVERMGVAVNNQFVPRNPKSLEGFQTYLETTLDMMKHLVTGKASGNHGEFLRHGIEALTVKTEFNPQWGNAGYTRITKVIEGMCRSLNNLLERFHQSFFFYILPSTDNYISIGMYMPALGMVLAAAALKALSIIWEENLMRNSEEENKLETEVNDEKGEGDTQTIDDLLEDMGSPLAGQLEKETDPGPSVMAEVLFNTLLCHVVGVALFYSPMFVETWSQMFNCPKPLSLLLLFATVQVSGIIFLPAYRLTYKASRILYVVTLLHMGIVFGTVSIINFTLGLFLAVCFALVSLLLEPGLFRYKFIQKLLGLLICPISIVVFTCLYNCSDNNTATCWANFERFHVDIYDQFQSQQGWLFGFGSLLLYPIWLQLWSVTNAPAQSEHQ